MYKGTPSTQRRVHSDGWLSATGASCEGDSLGVDEAVTVQGYNITVDGGLQWTEQEILDDMIKFYDETGRFGFDGHKCVCLYEYEHKDGTVVNCAIGRMLKKPSSTKMSSINVLSVRDEDFKPEFRYQDVDFLSLLQAVHDTWAQKNMVDARRAYSNLVQNHDVRPKSQHVAALGFDSISHALEYKG